MRSTLNVGALDLMGCSRVRLEEPARGMARRMMEAYRKLGCEQSWTCAPYQAGHRPALGSDVAWGESNAVVFCNSVLGARTNRYGDFLDIACAIIGPRAGLRPAPRREPAGATGVRCRPACPPAFLGSEIAWPMLGSLYGREVGNAVGVVTGVSSHPGEDALKAFGAAAASSGAVGLFHIAGVTPEAPDVETVAGRRQAGNSDPRHAGDGGEGPRAACRRRPRGPPSTRSRSAARICRSAEFDALERLIGGRRLSVPIYACTGRHVLADARTERPAQGAGGGGVVIVADTCVVVTPILPDLAGGVLMTNSGKFAHYAPGNTGYARALRLAGRLRRKRGRRASPVFTDIAA